MKRITALKRALLVVNHHHGSGIDGNWHLSENKDNVILKNSFHCMDENGYYDGWVDFKILIPKRRPDAWKVMTDGSYKSKKYGIKDYLEDTFCEELSNYESALCWNRDQRIEVKNSYYFVNDLKPVTAR